MISRDPEGPRNWQERQQIALGLADSLPYAEIARRLDRPTSTITREVMRNGGPTAYRADLAHRATERRAHQRRPASSRGSESVLQPHGRDAEAVAEYEERFTTVLVAAGLTKMPARVLSCLFTTDAGSLTASQLAQRLQVSPASISKAIAVATATSSTPNSPTRRRSSAPDPTTSSSKPHAKASPSSAPTPPPPPAWRTSPASSTSSAKESPAPPNKPATSSTPNPKQPQTTPPNQVQTTDRQPSIVTSISTAPTSART